jgi:hypothetical protein
VTDAARPLPATGVVVVIAGRPLNLANLRLWWVGRHRLMRDRKNLVAILAGSALARARSGPASSPCLVQATIYIAGVRFDPDNLVAALKADLDGLVDAGLLVDDSPKWLRLEVAQVRVPRREQRIEFRISPLAAPAAGPGPRQLPPAHEVVLPHPGSGGGHRSGERYPSDGQRRCPACGVPLPPRLPGPGHERVWCSSACKGRAAVRRARGLPVDYPKQPPGGRRPLGAPGR